MVSGIYLSLLQCSNNLSKLLSTAVDLLKRPVKPKRGQFANRGTFIFHFPYPVRISQLTGWSYTSHLAPFSHHQAIYFTVYLFSFISSINFCFIDSLHQHFLILLLLRMLVTSLFALDASPPSIASFSAC